MSTGAAGKPPQDVSQCVLLLVWNFCDDAILAVLPGSCPRSFTGSKYDIYPSLDAFSCDMWITQCVRLMISEFTFLHVLGNRFDRRHKFRSRRSASHRKGGCGK